MTDGIAIRDIAVSDDVKKQEYQFACWDFAGQEYYYSSSA
jgi:GTPase SAR1 family protein